MSELMQSLELTIARLSELERSSRLDAEYFQKKYMHSAKLIEKWDREHVAHLTEVSDGNHFSISEDFVEEGIPYYRGQDVVGRFFIETSSPNHISREAYDKKHMVRSHLKKGDVLLSIVGTIGELSLVTTDEPSTCSCKLAILRPKQISPEFLAIFLRSEHGQNQIERLTRGAVQKGLILDDLDQLWIPQVSKKFEAKIVEIIKKSRSTQELATRRQLEAEQVLLEALGSGNWTPAQHLTYQSNASTVFAAGRIDAQYFMPAKEKVRRALSAVPGEPLMHRVDAVKDQWLPEEAPPQACVRNYDVTDALVPLLDAEKAPSTAAEIGSMKRVFQGGDVVVSRLRSYLKEIAVVRTSGDIPLVGSSEFIVLRPKQRSISPEALMVFLRSAPVQTILKWCQDGSQHPRFSESDLLSIPLPDAVLQASPAIAKVVQQGFSARHHAQLLLKLAKRAVEIAIETGESSAFEFLDAEVG